jgi:predicted N-acetyltransferase YhbS
MEEKAVIDVKVRAMTGRDLSSILSYDWSEIPEKDMVALQLGGKVDASLVAELDQQLIGFILARVVFVGRPMISVCQLHLMAVKPDHQGKGVGSMMLDSLYDQCASNHVSTIRALVKDDDAKLLDYFERLGFHRSHTLNLEIACD